MIKIVIVGSSNTDMVVRVPRIPAPGETVLGGQFVMAAGGKGANQAVAAARLGAEVTLVTCVGQDLFGQQAIANIRREGIDTRYVATAPEAASGVALIAVDATGENSIAVAPGANMHLSPQAVQAASGAIQAADALLLQLEVPFETVLAAAELAHRAGVRVILNPAPAPAQPVPEVLLACVDVLTPNESEMAALTDAHLDAERTARHLIAQGVGTVIVTLGPRGALLVRPDEARRVPAFAVEAVDTTAAGDAFNGGLAVALAREAPFMEAVRFANACGALAATRLGAQPSLPTAAEVEAFLSFDHGENQNDLSKL